MTLVAGFDFGGVPVLIGDALLTGDSMVADELDLPAVRNANHGLLKNSRFKITGLRQKIQVVSERLTIAFAGDYMACRSLVEHFHLLSADLHTKANVEQYLQQLADAKQADVSVLIYVQTTTEIHTCYYDAHRFNQGAFTNGFVIGSGRLAALNIIRQLPSMTSETASGATLVGRAVAAAMLVSTACFGEELRSGSTLLERWGGAFEVCAFADNGAHKIGHQMYIYMQASVVGQEIKLTVLPTFTKMSYYGDLLFARTFRGAVGDVDPSESLHVIGPFFPNTDPDAIDWNDPIFADLSYLWLNCYVLTESLGVLTFTRFCGQTKPVVVERTPDQYLIKVEDRYLAMIAESVRARQTASVSDA